MPKTKHGTGPRHAALGDHLQVIVLTDGLRGTLTKLEVTLLTGMMPGSPAEALVLMDMLHYVQRAAILAVGVLLRLQVGFENRLEHQQCSQFRDTIFYGGNS